MARNLLIFFKVIINFLSYIISESFRIIELFVDLVKA